MNYVRMPSWVKLGIFLDGLKSDIGGDIKDGSLHLTIDSLPSQKNLKWNVVAEIRTRAEGDKRHGWIHSFIPYST